MTIALGMICRDGVVIASDTELSAENYDKTHESKIHFFNSDGRSLLLGYADTPSLDREAREKIVRRLAPSQPTPQAVYDACEEVFTQMREFHGDLELQMVIGASCPASDTKLIVFDSAGLYWEHGIKCLGTGDCSLTNYLAKAAYHPTMTTAEGRRLAAYLVKCAKRYVDGCSGDTLLYSIHDGGEIRGTPPEDILALDSEMLAREDDGIKLIIGL